MPSGSEVTVNVLFFMSLAISLSTALFSVLFKQWLTAYSSKISGNPKDIALIRHFRFDGLVKWKVAGMIGLLPFFLHASVGLFAAGLLVYIRQRNDAVFTATVSVFGTTGILYLTSILLPPFFPECPYHFSLLDRPLRLILPNAWLLAYGGILWLARSARRLYRPTRYPPEFRGPRWPKARKDWERYLAYTFAHNISGAIIWLHQLTSNPTTRRAVAKSLAGVLPYSFPHWTAEWLRNRRVALELSSIVPSVSHLIWKGLVASAMINPLPTSPDEVRSAIDPFCSTYNPWVKADVMLHSWIYYWYHDQKLITNNRILTDKLGNIRSRLFGGAYAAYWYLNGDVRAQWLKYFLTCRDIYNPYTGKWAVRAVDWNTAQHSTGFARNGQTDIVQILVAEFPDSIDSGDENNLTAVYQAAAAGHLDTVKVLVEARANLTLGSPLVAACKGTHIDVVRYLLDQPHVTETIGCETAVEESPFHWAVQESSDELVRLLLEKEVPISQSILAELVKCASKSTLDPATVGLIKSQSA